MLIHFNIAKSIRKMTQKNFKKYHHKVTMTLIKWLLHLSRKDFHMLTNETFHLLIMQHSLDLSNVSSSYYMMIIFKKIQVNLHFRQKHRNHQTYCNIIHHLKDHVKQRFDLIGMMSFDISANCKTKEKSQSFSLRRFSYVDKENASLIDNVSFFDSIKFF